MGFGIGKIAKTVARPMMQAALPAALPAVALLKPVDKVQSAMLKKLTDGFESAAKSSKSTSPSTTAPAKKKKKHGLFHKLGGLLKKALPMVSKLASFIPGLNAVAQPLQLAGSLFSKE